MILALIVAALVGCAYIAGVATGEASRRDHLAAAGNEVLELRLAARRSAAIISDLRRENLRLRAEVRALETTLRSTV